MLYLAAGLLATLAPIALYVYYYLGRVDRITKATEYSLLMVRAHRALYPLSKRPLLAREWMGRA